MSKRDWEKQREVLGPHHRSPTHIPSTSPSLHYLHVNDSSLCPAEGRKRPINTTAQKARTLFNPRRVDLLHPHTPTHVEAHSNTQSPKCSQQVEHREEVGLKNGHSGGRVFNLLHTTRRSEMDSLQKPRLFGWVWTTGNMSVLFNRLLTFAGFASRQIHSMPRGFYICISVISYWIKVSAKCGRFTFLWWAFI